ncbi:CHRD domain protein [Candidatus Nitrosocosmicus oleophilus]|uniref:CHRD domain protein n=1 Tax=Candidatus Nitrosocosmicus oleophilus TaxID=1353260 RepID=A0A654M375_9ARCH|nr:CHRD domain-containing protein [Candidatus Nitrosocosmicus oleophilus]ALI36869.1 CHRD domain protein [Candidatus Nitrosocosmicus oleophilus]
MRSEHSVLDLDNPIFIVLLVFFAILSNICYVWGQTNSTYIASLNGTNVLPSAYANSSGIGEIVISRDSEGNVYEVVYNILLKNISNILTVDLHNAPEGINGTTTYSIYDIFSIPRVDQNSSSVVLRGSLDLINFESTLGGKADPSLLFSGSNPFTYEALERELLFNRTYIDVHTAKFPEGELRGQLHPIYK